MASKKNSLQTAPPLKEKKRKHFRRPPVPPEVSAARRYAAYQMRIMNPRMTFAAITKELNELFPEYPLKSEHQAVEKMIKEAEKEYIDTHKSKVDEIKAEAGAALDWVRHEAAEAWKRSQDLLKIIKKKEGQTVEQILKAEFGNAQFLRRITEAIEVKTKIYGALAPKRHELTGKDGAPLVPSFNLKSLSKYLSDGDLVKVYEAAEVLERAQRAYDLEAAAENTD
jgi:hypothetical protein